MQQLLRLTSTGICSAADAEDHLLAALAVASAATAAPLTTGLLQLYQSALDSQPSCRDTAEAAVSVSWRSHPLCKVLLANSTAAQPLLLGVLQWVSRVADEEASDRFSVLLRSLEPFLTFVMLDPQLALQQPLLALQLFTALARLACSCRSQHAQLQLLRLLVARLPAFRLVAVSDLPQECVAAQALAVVMDVVETLDCEPGRQGGCFVYLL